MRINSFYVCFFQNLLFLKKRVNFCSDTYGFFNTDVLTDCLKKINHDMMFYYSIDRLASGG